MLNTLRLVVWHPAATIAANAHIATPLRIMLLLEWLD
jgi:hypothetical protein